MTEKIVHIITGLNDGGAEGVLTRLCLHSENLQHVVISMVDEGKYGATLRQSGVVVHCLGMSPGKPSIGRIYQLIRLIRSEQPAIVQTWMYHADLLGGIAAKLAGVDKIFWGVRQTNLVKGSFKRSTIIVAWLCRFLSRWIPEKIVCCAEKAMTAHAELGYCAEKMLVIPNGYDLHSFKPDKAASVKIRERLGLNASDFVVGMVGRYVPQKDHLNLLRALARVSERNIPFRCLLIGKGLSRDNTELVQYISELRLQEKVLLIGQQSDVSEFMNAMDLHILSSLSEGFPNVVAEAMACGTPCISTNVGDAMQIIGDPEACCASSDSQALAELIIKSALEWELSPSLWQARKAESRRRIIEKFSIEAMVEAYETCWFGTARDRALQCSG